MLRRVQDRVQQRLSHGHITIDETTRRVTVGEKPINLSRTLYLLLAAFMRHPNQVLTRDQLIALAFDEEARDILSTALYHKPQSRKTRRTPFVPDLHPWTRPSWTFLPFTHAHDLLIR